VLLTATAIAPSHTQPVEQVLALAKNGQQPS
jgi:hypothetical protein